MGELLCRLLEQVLQSTSQFVACSVDSGIMIIIIKIITTGYHSDRHRGCFIYVYLLADTSCSFRYNPFLSLYRFVPLAFETLGPIKNPGVAEIMELGHFLTNINYISESC